MSFKYLTRNIYSNMSKLGTVVIGGGSGFIGNAISRTLQENGYKVITISRKPGPYRMSWNDLSNGLPQCVAVINVAGQNVLDPRRRWTTGFKQNVWSSRVNTTKSLAKAIYQAQEPPKVFATISGVGIYKPSPTEEYTEDSPDGENPDFLGELCKDWEAATSLPEDFPIRRVIIRSGVVLGREGGLISQLIWPFFLGLGGPVGSGKQFMPWIHVEDVAELFRYSIENKHVSGILNGVAPQIITNAEFAKTFGRQMWRPAVIPLPIFAINLAFGEERAKLMTEGQKVIPKRTLETGFRYKYPDINSASKEFSKLTYADEMR